MTTIVPAHLEITDPCIDRLQARRARGLAIMRLADTMGRSALGFALALRADLSEDDARLLLAEGRETDTVEGITAWLAHVPPQPAGARQ